MTSDDKIIMKVKEEDKKRFKRASEKLALSLSGYMKMAAAERTNKILEKEEVKHD